MQPRERESISGIEQDSGYDVRRAEFFVNVKLSRLFWDGAAVNSKGQIAFLTFEEIENLNLTEEDRARYESGRIIGVRSDILPNQDATTYLIPPKTATRLAYREVKSHSGGKLKPYPVILLGFNEDGEPITDYFERNSPFMEGLREIARNTLTEKRIKQEDLSLPLRTIVMNALVDISKQMGVGNLEEYSLKAKKL